jgi:hypothetical protein
MHVANVGASGDVLINELSSGSVGSMLVTSSGFDPDVNAELETAASFQ